MSSYILPIIIFLIVIYGVIKKCNVYDSFIKGSKEGIEIGISIFPSILAIIFSSRILISSGFIDYLLSILEPLLEFLSFPKEIFPMAILRPISGNASLSLMLEIFSKYGVDSKLGFIASTLQGSTDTTFYVISLYFGVVGIKKIKHSLYAALLVDLIGIITTILLVNFMIKI